MSKTAVFALWAFVAGAGIPVMAALNGALATQIGGPRAAALVLFVVGLAAAALAFGMLGGSWRALGAVAHAPPQLLLGGVIVAFYIFSVTTLVPSFGVANTILFVLLAQTITSTAIDHFGLFGAQVRPVDAVRLAGVVLVGVGLAVTQMPRPG